MDLINNKYCRVHEFYHFAGLPTTKLYCDVNNISYRILYETFPNDGLHFISHKPPQNQDNVAKLIFRHIFLLEVTYALNNYRYKQISLFQSVIGHLGLTYRWYTLVTFALACSYENTFNTSHSERRSITSLSSLDN